MGMKIHILRDARHINTISATEAPIGHSPIYRPQKYTFFLAQQIEI